MLTSLLLPMRKSQEYCGLEELPHLSCHNVIKNPQFELDKERYIQYLTKVFGDLPLAASEADRDLSENADTSKSIISS